MENVSIALLLVFFMVVMLISAFIVKVGWLLFMVPVFGMKPITLLQGVGFVLLAGAFRGMGVATSKMLK